MVKESQVNAYHNYLIGNVLTESLHVGNGKPGGFHFWAKPVHPGDSIPLISASLFDDNGQPLVTLADNEIVDNPGGCFIVPASNGFSLVDSHFQGIVSVEVRAYTRSYLTCIRGVIKDENGRIRIEDGTQI
jgi:hypothetical protein